MKVSIVIPARNEEANVKKMLNLLFRNFNKQIYELIVVDDCSTDSTPKLLDCLKKKYNKLKVVHRKQKPGVGNAIKKGLKSVSSKSEYVLMLDCDFVENIDDIKKQIKLIGDSDGVLGSRYMKGGNLVNYPIFKKIANRSFHMLAHLLLNISQVDLTNNFKFYKKQVVDDILPLLQSTGFSINAETGLYPVLLGYNLKESPVSWIGRTAEMGSSNFKIVKAGPGYAEVLLKSLKYKYFGFPKTIVPLETSERIHFDNLIKRTGETYYGNLRKISTLRFKRKIREILKISNINSKSKFLEIGCGTGLFSKYLLDQNSSLNIDCVDVSPEAIRVAKITLRKYNDVQFKIGSILKLPYQSKKFDIVFGNSILHHLPLTKALEEIKRVLKPGGTIWFCEPNLLNPQIFMEKNIPLFKPSMQDSKDETAYLRGILKKDLKRCGFKNISVEPYEFLHPFLPKFLINFALSLEKIPVIREFAGTLKVVASK